jgi:N-acylneuraminate cytidylyltransferase
MSPPKVLVLIPARGGSRSIPKKNIVPVAGHPLIAYSIACGLASKRADRVIVSTDSDEIAETALRYGAEVPFRRPQEFAADDTPDFPVFAHALEWLASRENYWPEVVVHLRPTSPLRPKDLLDQAVDLYLNTPGADCVRGVVAAEENPFKMWVIGPGGELIPVVTGEFKEHYNMPRQSLPKVFWQTGHIDVIGIRTLTEKRSMTGDHIFPIVIDRRYLTDIDEFEHLTDAENKISAQKKDLHWPEAVIPIAG